MKVVALTRFPVKSMAGEVMTAIDLRWPGILGDRRHSFVRRDEPGRFPWLTGRDVPALVLHQPSETATGIRVRAPDGAECALDDPALAARLTAEAGREVALMQVGRGIFDTMPVSVITTGSLARIDAAHRGTLDAAHGAPLDARRFRINIVIESDADESEWTGHRLDFESGAQLLANDPIPRCAMVTICPETAARDAGVMRTVAQRFDNLIGLYAATARPGAIRLGDSVALTPIPSGPAP